MNKQFSDFIQTRNPFGLKDFLDNGYQPTNIDYHSVLFNYDHQVEECKEIIRVLGMHPTTRDRYMVNIITFANFTIFGTFMEGVERIESDKELNEFIFKVIPIIRYGIRQFILNKNTDDVNADDYPIVQIVDRLLQSPRIDLSDPPKEVLYCILNEPDLLVYNLYARAGYKPYKYDIEPLVYARNLPILNYLLSVININVKNKDGETALSYIVNNKDLSVNREKINTLIILGANPNIMDITGYNARDHFVLS